MKSSMTRMAQLLVKNRPHDGFLLICNMSEPEVTRCQSTQSHTSVVVELLDN